MAESFIDSNVLVGAANTNDSLHARAVKVLLECERPIVVHEYAILETAAVLMTRANKQLADAFVYGILRNPDVKILWSSPTSFIAGTGEFLQTKTKLSLVDATFLALSKEYSVVTFDKALQKAIQAKKSDKTGL